MSTTHTPGPWETVAVPGNSAPRIVGDLYSVADCLPAGGSDHANAARIVACVNACEGIADPAAVPRVVEALRALEVAAQWAEEDGRVLGANAPEMLAARLALAALGGAQ